MGPIRKALCLVFALALTAGGLYLLSLIFTADSYAGELALAGSMMLSLGVYWLWVDFIKPAQPES